MTTSQSLAEYLPRDVIKEIDSLEPISKAILLVELTEEILENQDGFLELQLSATSTQNIKALTTHQTLELSEYLCLSLRNYPSLPQS